MSNIIVINYQGTQTENEVYQIVLSNIREMINGVGNNAELLSNLRFELKDALAIVENRQYRLAHPNLGQRIEEEPLKIF